MEEETTMGNEPRIHDALGEIADILDLMAERIIKLEAEVRSLKKELGDVDYLDVCARANKIIELKDEMDNHGKLINDLYDKVRRGDNKGGKNDKGKQRKD